MKVGVYGTLKNGHGNHHLLTDSKWCYNTTIQGFSLYVSGIPYAMEDSKSTTPLHIEVYEVDNATLARLDRLEGHPRAYERKPFNIGEDEVWIYTYNHEHIKSWTRLEPSGVYQRG